MRRAMVALWICAASTCCYSSGPDAGAPRTASEVVLNVLTSLASADMRSIDDASVAKILGAAEARNIRRLPVTITRQSSHNLWWQDAAGDYSIIFARRWNPHDSFSEFRFAGRATSAAEALRLLRAWLAAVRPDLVAILPETFERQHAPYVESERDFRGATVRVSAAIDREDDRTWTAKLQFEDIRRQ